MTMLEALLAAGFAAAAAAGLTLWRANRRLERILHGTHAAAVRRDRGRHRGVMAVAAHALAAETTVMAPVAGSDLPPRGAGVAQVAAATALDADQLLAGLDPLQQLAGHGQPREVPPPPPISLTDDLIDRSSLGTETAAEMRSGVPPRGELTGMGPEQADWEADLDDALDVEPTPGDDEEGLPQDETRVTGGTVHRRFDWPATGWRPGDPPPNLPTPAGVMPREWMLTSAVRQAAAAVRSWVADVDGWSLTRWIGSLQRQHEGRHRLTAGQHPWTDYAAERSRQWRLEREAALRATRWLIAEETGATWGRQLQLMRESLRPPRRTLPPTMPSMGCTP